MKLCKIKNNIAIDRRTIMKYYTICEDFHCIIAIPLHNCWFYVKSLLRVADRWFLRNNGSLRKLYELRKALIIMVKVILVMSQKRRSQQISSNMSTLYFYILF